MAAASSIDPAAVEAALLRGEDGVLAELFKHHSPADRNAALSQIAERSLQNRQWTTAVAALSRIDGDNLTASLQLNLARNFLCLQQHRPSVYEAVVAAPADSRFQLAASATGLPTIHYQSPPISFSIGNDPLKGASALWAKLKPDLDRGLPIALCGLGDGYLLGALAQKPPALFLSMQQTVHIVEPHPQVLLLCMMMHDYTHGAGPIRQSRFRWHVGPTWQQSVRDDLLGDLLTPMPAITVNQGTAAPGFTELVQQLQQDLTGDDAARKAEVDAYYAGIPREQWLDAFSTVPARPPRVMLITTRFSTVLQYSTAHAAEAFGQLGWETRTMIEPSDWQRFSPQATRKMLVDFKPDFVFQIDHLRHEHGDLYPPQLPFACWIQDHLPNLCNAMAGAKVQRRDFVLTGMGSLFVQQHGYPRRQIIDLPQLSRVPMRPTEWASDGDDLVYVSNWSKPAGAVRSELLEQYSQPPMLQSLVQRCCDQIQQRYEAGGAVHTPHDVRQIVSDCEHATGVTLTISAEKDQLINTLFDRLNNTLYRHQALHWAADVAQQRGLKLALYGRGWESHPTLSPYARGPVAPGEALERLARQSRINLQLEPYACFSHARLLSGLFAGGFFLIRDHPFNHLTQELLNFVDLHLDADVCTVDDALAGIKPQHRGKLNDLLTRCACLAEQVDPIGLVRDWQRGGTLLPQSASLPRLGDVAFSDRDSLASAIDRFINNPELRYDISTEQRQNTQSRLSYRAGLDRVIRAIGKRLAGESAGEQAQAA